MRKFGSITVNECDILLSDLLKPETLPAAANLFFELYLDDGQGRFIDVPALVRNRRSGGATAAGGSEDNSLPNLGVAVSNEWKLARRFFVYDTISGISGGGISSGGFGAEGAGPEYVRWAEELSLKVEMDMERPERIYRPYVAVRYKAAKVPSHGFDSSSRARARFVVEYFSDYQSLMQSVLIGLIFMSILAAAATLLRVCCYARRNPSSAMGSSKEAHTVYIYKVLFNLIDTWSEYVFWLLFFSCSSIFIAYKMQTNAYLLLPELGEATEPYYNAFKTLLTLTLVLRLATVLLAIIQQTLIDVYFVDFEERHRETGQVNGWRYLFVANEFAELQTEMRYVQPETTFIWFAFFWVGLGWQYVSETTPDSSYVDSGVQVQNVLLKFFMVGILFFGIGAV